MRMPTPTQVETTAWLLLCGGLAVTIALEVDWGRGWRLPAQEISMAPSEFSAPALASPFVLPSPDTLSETSVRPIFVVTRRPAPIPPPEEVAKPMMKRGQFVLTGVSITPDGSHAFLLEKATGKNHVVALGKQVNGIAVSEILPNRIVMTEFDDSEVLLLVPAKGAPAPTAAPAPAKGPAVPGKSPRLQTARPNPPPAPGSD